MIRPSEDGLDDERLIAAAEAYDASLRSGDTVSLEFSKQHPDLASVFELLNDVFSPAASPVDSSPPIEQASSTPLRFGRFQVRSELGRGGFATVYRAYDELLKREVAVKVFAGTKCEKDVSIDSRLNEARAVARLSHPNIVPVYEVHEEADAVYLVSEFCDGPTLDDWLTMHPGHVAVDVAVDIVQQLAEAVAHAHARGLVHRDIKPGNVMMSPADQRVTSLRFIPRLTDFGLASDSIDTREPAAPFGLVGTLGFMAPELVLGHQTEPHPICDVYALGVLMYQMLTGHLPHQATSTLELMKSICTKEIALPRAIRPMLPADVEAICMKCLARDPAQRYASADGVADDIGRWKRGQSVLARPQSRIEQVLQTARKHPVESSLLATVFVGAVTAAIVLAQLNHRLSDRQQQLRGALSEATQQRNLAETHRQAAVRTAYRADLARGFEAYGQGHSAEAQRIAQSIQQYALDAIPIGSDLRILNALTVEGTTAMTGHDGAVNGLATIANHAIIASAGDDSMVRLHDRTSGAFVDEHSIASDAKVTAIAASPDGTTLAVAYSKAQVDGEVLEGNAVAIVRWQDWQTVQTWHGFSTTVAALAFSPDGTRIAIGCRYQNVVVQSLTSASDRVMIESDRRNEDLAFTRDGNQLLVFCRPDTIRMYDSNNGQVAQQLSIDFQPHRVALSPRNSWIAVSDFHNPIIRLYARDNLDRVEAVLSQSYGDTQCIAFSDSGDRLVAGLRSGGVVCWDLSELRQARLASDVPHSVSPLCHQTPLSEPVSAVVFGSEDTVICGGENGLLTRCLLSNRFNQPPELAPFVTRTAVLSGDGRSIYAGCVDGRLVALDIQAKAATVVETISSHVASLNKPLIKLTLSSTGNYLAVGWNDGSVALLQLPSGAVVWLKKASNLPSQSQTAVHSILFDVEDQSMVIFRNFNEFEVWNCSTINNGRRAVSNQPLSSTTHSLQRRLGAVCLLADRNTMIYGGIAEDVREFRLGGESERSILPKCGRVTCLLYDLNRKRIISGDTNGRIMIHTLHGELVAKSRYLPNPSVQDGNRTDVTSFALSPDGRNLISGNSDGEVRIWDAEDLRFLGTIHARNGHGSINTIDYSKDGSRLMYHQALASSDQAGGVYLLHLN